MIGLSIFFHGENEEALMASTLNSIEPAELGKWTQALNEYLGSPAFWSGHDVVVEKIVFDGCEDVILQLKGGEEVVISGLDTFSDILAELA